MNRARPTRRMCASDMEKKIPSAIRMRGEVICAIGVAMRVTSGGRSVPVAERNTPTPSAQNMGDLRIRLAMVKLS